MLCLVTRERLAWSASASSTFHTMRAFNTTCVHKCKLLSPSRAAEQTSPAASTWHSWSAPTATAAWRAQLANTDLRWQQQDRCQRRQLEPQSHAAVEGAVWDRGHHVVSSTGGPKERGAVPLQAVKAFELQGRCQHAHIRVYCARPHALFATTATSWYKHARQRVCCGVRCRHTFSKGASAMSLILLGESCCSQAPVVVGSKHAPYSWHLTGGPKTSTTMSCVPLHDLVTMVVVAATVK